MTNALIGLLTQSKALKRKIANYLSVLLGMVRGIPELAFVIPTLELIAGSFGVVGLGHAAAKNTVSGKNKILSWGALFAALVAAAQFYPPLAPALPILTKLALLFGAIGFGQNLKRS